MMIDVRLQIDLESGRLLTLKFVLPMTGFLDAEIALAIKRTPSK